MLLALKLLIEIPIYIYLIVNTQEGDDDVAVYVMMMVVSDDVLMT